MQVYTGKTDNKREINQGKQAIMDAVEPYFDSWRDAVFDKFLTSVASAEEVLKKKAQCAPTN